jgi:predicted SnoaL-like aldol condensation-catalyzing enzyme
MKTTSQKQLIEDFIYEIWNHERFNSIDTYLHTTFTDHSLPPAFETNKNGLISWIKSTGQSFEHKSIIEEHVYENNTSIIKFRMQLRHIGVWRGIEPTFMEISVVGYRCFKLQDNKIVGHWALIDGNSIENQLKACTHGCKLQQ